MENTYSLATKSSINHYRHSEICRLLCGEKPFGSRHWEYPWCVERGNVLDQTGLRILDIAPDFTFPFSSFLKADHEVSFIDLEKQRWSDTVAWGAELSDIARRSDYRIMDVRDMSFADETFDTIFCISVLEHIVCPTQDPDHPRLAHIFNPEGARPALQEMKRCLKTGGQLILTIDIYQGVKWKPFFDQWNILDDLIDCGFSVPMEDNFDCDKLMTTPDIFLSDFHGPYFTMGFSLKK